MERRVAHVHTDCACVRRHQRISNLRACLVEQKQRRTYAGASSVRSAFDATKDRRDEASVVRQTCDVASSHRESSSVARCLRLGTRIRGGEEARESEWTIVRLQRRPDLELAPETSTAGERTRKIGCFSCSKAGFHAQRALEAVPTFYRDLRLRSMLQGYFPCSESPRATLDSGTNSDSLRDLIYFDNTSTQNVYDLRSTESPSFDSL